jgi:hypothetical protein
VEKFKNDRRNSWYSPYGILHYHGLNSTSLPFDLDNVFTIKKARRY